MNQLATLDLVVIAAYLLGIAALGWWAGRGDRARSLQDFFLGGRTMPWWLIGTSMVATTLAADTPLAVAGLTLKDGVAGNWFWWSAAVSHVLVTVALARLWRRAEVVTDAEFCELRFAGRAAAGLRSFKAFYFAVPINCIIMGWVFLAMAKVGSAVFPEVPAWGLIGALVALVLLYSLRAGLMGVVLTDLVQFPIALFGTVALAWIVVRDAGGLDRVLEAAIDHGGPEAIELLPFGGELLPWHTLVAFLAVQWWAQRSSDGGGILVQRLSAARSERDAELGGLWFCVAHYILRPWPWVLTGLAALVLLPPEVVAADPEGTYPVLMMTHLPIGLRGLLVAAFLAAFMSTVDTHLNWGGSYIANDLIQRWRPMPPERLAVVSRLSVLGIAALAVAGSTMMDTVAGAWKFLVVLGSGAGAVTLLRWYWWRVSAVTELVALLASGVLGTAVYLAFPDWEYIAQLGLVVVGSALLWVPTLWTHAPDPTALADFYTRVRPPGPGWQKVAAALDEPAPQSMLPHLGRWMVGLVGILGCLLGTGRLLLGGPTEGVVGLVVGLAALVWLARTSAAENPGPAATRA